LTAEQITDYTFTHEIPVSKQNSPQSVSCTFQEELKYSHITDKQT